MLQDTQDIAIEGVKGARMVQLIKEHRIEAMIVTILLYSTGLLERAWTYGSGVCA
jgi:hypothetical protein